MSINSFNSSSPTPVIYPREQHSISRRMIDPDALKIMYRLARHGFKAYLVGGGVRDLLLGKSPKDFDIATDATPRKIKALFRNCRIIGRRFKLAHVFFGGGKIIEVSTFRDFSDPIDPQEESEPAESRIITDNKYGTEATDAVRRDLTINGLFYDISTYSVIDYVGGVRDLQDGLIRMIGEPNSRFAEDPVRMIRAVRHAVRSGFAIESGCADAISKNRQLIKSCPPMRVYEELKKDFSSGHLINILRLLGTTGLLDFLLPSLSALQGPLFERTSFISKFISRVDDRVRDGEPPSPAVVLAAVALASLLDSKGSAGADIAALSEEELKQHVDSCFSDIAVPRREKERILALLQGIVFLHIERTDQPSKGFHFSESIDDLSSLLRIIGASEELEERAAQEIIPHRSGGRRGQQQGRGRGPRKRRFSRNPNRRRFN